ncbi:Ff.00g065720.m01.CDS01 [Fusarium sp. VM40]|nr:Ff.00g065720.m01.CDS01 [Fusarium sp. VM40]
MGNAALARALSPVPLTARLSELLTTLEDAIAKTVDTVNAVMQTWDAIHREFFVTAVMPNVTGDVRLLLFPAWAVVHVGNDILAFVCQRRLAAEVNTRGGSDLSRLNTLAGLLNWPHAVFYFVLRKHITNNKIIQAFRVVCGLPDAVTFVAFYGKAETVRCEMGTVNREVKRVPVIRDTLKSLGATDVWPGSKAGSRAGSLGPSSIDAHNLMTLSFLLSTVCNHQHVPLGPLQPLFHFHNNIVRDSLARPSLSHLFSTPNLSLSSMTNFHLALQLPR